MTTAGCLHRATGRTIDAFAYITAEFHVLRYRLLSRFGVMTFQQASECVAERGSFVGYRIRSRFYRSLLAACGEELEVNWGATVGEISSRIGDRVWIGPGAYLDLVDVGDDVLIGPHACVLGGGRHHRTDRTDLPIRWQGNNPARVTTIGDGAWIGANAVVMADVGGGSIVGAGAVVTKPVPSMAVAVGNPARVVRLRDAASI
jgi:acetyltransferase-like isoleucine patch superfamily enzyme